MSSLSTVFAFLLIVISQTLDGGEAGPCATETSVIFRKVTLSAYPGEEFFCELGDIDYCRGGCKASFRYDVHETDSIDAKRRCTPDVWQCTASGTQFVYADSLYCTYDNGTRAQKAEGHSFPTKEVAGCSCQREYDGGVSESDCKNKFSRFIV